ncbi:ABC transporter permease subunit [Thermococcus sp. MV5]|uniref:ABC transporter permease subunit n=1 Tax=Thermococcus sp. MV5 TaxID=1638272 RepID=UPI00143940AE
MFIFAIKYNILPASGLMSIPPEEGIGLAFDILKHLILPVATIVFVFVWEFIVIVARETQKEFGEVYIITEIAKGMPNKVIYWKHILKNIGITLSSFTGQKFMEMFTDYLVLDAFFSLQGLGLLLKNSFVREVVPNVGVVVNFRPYLFFPLTIIIATLFFVISLVIELIKGMLDPRVS